MLFAVAGALIGAALGMRLIVISLLPTLLVTVLIALCAAVAGVDWSLTVLHFSIFVICLQMGFLCSSALRFVGPFGRVPPSKAVPGTRPAAAP
jgi:hypothetical protein